MSTYVARDYERVSTTTRAPRESPDDRHLAAVRRSLGWAEDAAQRGDYADALGWVRVVEAVGGPLPDIYITQRQAWACALAEHQASEGASRARGSPTESL